MFTYTSKQLPKHTKEYLVEITWDTIVSKREESFRELSAFVNAPGFRQGKAPKDVAAKHIHPEKLYERVIRKLLPELYKELVEKESLKPVTSPAVELTEAKENVPWKLTVKVAEIPEVILKDYKGNISEAHKKAAKSKEDEKKKEQSENTKAENDPKRETIADQKVNESKKIVAPLSEVFTLLLAHTTCEIPDLLTEEDVNRKLSQLADDIRRVGLTVEQYLTSKKTTLDEVKTQYRKDSDEMYRIEFVLAKIAEVENIRVEQKEIDDILAGAKTDKEVDAAKANLAWYESMLRKQKVLDYLNSL